MTVVFSGASPFAATSTGRGAPASARSHRAPSVRAAANGARIDIAPSVGTGPAFVARARATLSATVFAPDGDVVLGPFGDYRGAVVGRTIVVGRGARLRGDSAL